MPERVRQILEEVGDNPILKIQLGRTPVEKVLILFLNIVSGWKFNKKQIELGYDEIYHNYLLITIQNEKGPNVLQSKISNAEDVVGSMIYKLDKAHRVRLMEPTYPTEFVDIYEIPLTPNKIFTLNRLITTASNIDKQFYSYDAGNNNMCQTFVENIVDINGLTSNIIDEETRMALKPQDAKALVATLGKRSDVVKRITDLGGKLDKLVFDNKIKWKIPVNKEFALFGHMHIKPANDTANDNTDELLRITDDAVIVSGTIDIVIENEDEIFNAVVALEEEDKEKERKKTVVALEKERKKKMIIIVGIILAILLFVSAAAAITFCFWRKRKSKLQQHELIDKTKIDSNLSKASGANRDEQLSDAC
jgi:hypothetical protein